MINDAKYWEPDHPERWDWAAGLFTRMCAEHLREHEPVIHTVDVSPQALDICKVITADYADMIRYHRATSEDFLRAFDGTVDLLYVDAGETVAGIAALHLREASIALARRIFSPRALILIDDVDVSGRAFSRGKYSIPFFCQSGFEIGMSDYQVVLQKATEASSPPIEGSASDGTTAPSGTAAAEISPARDALADLLQTALTRPTALTPARVSVIGRALRLGPDGGGACEIALGVLAAVLYARPDLVEETLLDRLAELPKARPLPASIGAAVVKVFEFLAASPVAPRAWTLLGGMLRDERLDPGTRGLLLPLLRDFVQWREDLVGLDGILALAECPALANHRAFLLDYVVERFVFSHSESFTVETVERIAALFRDTPRYRYFLYSLVQRRTLPPEVRGRIASWLDGAFPLQGRAAGILKNRPFKLLVALNVRMGQGDDTVRLAPLLQALLDANPALTVALITRRPYLYDNPRVTAISIDEQAAVESALAEEPDGIVEVFESVVPALAFRRELHSALARVIAARPPAFLIKADLDRNHFVYRTVELAGRDIARARGLDRLGLRNIYETGMRLCAELGLPQRAAEERPLTPSVLAGVRSADAERAWARLVGGGETGAPRPVALLNPFGGAKAAKGFLEPHSGLLAREIAGLVEEGYLIVLLPNGTAWGSGSAIARVLPHLDPATRAHVRIAPDPAEPEEAERLHLTERPALASADRVMRLFKYFATYADLVITTEGWLMHLAYCLGRPFRLFLAAQSYTFDWHPHGRGRDQRLVTALSPRSRARYSESGLLGEGDPPPLPHRPRKTLLELALHGLGLVGGPGAVGLLRRALASQDHEVRAWAVAGLGRTRPVDTVKGDLLAALADREPTVVREAADALLRRRPDCRGDLGPRYRERIQAHADVSRQHWGAVRRLGTAALLALFRAAESDNDVIRREARWMLGQRLASRAPQLRPSRPTC